MQAAGGFSRFVNMVHFCLASKVLHQCGQFEYEILARKRLRGYRSQLNRSRQDLPHLKQSRSLSEQTKTPIPPEYFSIPKKINTLTMALRLNWFQSTALPVFRSVTAAYGHELRRCCLARKEGYNKKQSACHGGSTREACCLCRFGNWLKSSQT